MGARITCRQEIKKEISDFLLEDRIYKLVGKAKLSAEQKAVLLEITNRM